MKKNSIFANIATWLEKPLVFISTILSIVTVVFGIGYAFRGFMSDMEKIKLEVDCSERVLAEKEKCSEYRRQVESEKIISLTNAVEELKRANLNKQDVKQ